MQPHAAERRHLDRQITYARPIFMVLALGVLLEEPPQARGAHAIPFILGYLGAALALLAVEHVVRLGDWQVPLLVDLAALCVFLLLTKSVAAFWFVYLFVALAAGIRWGLERSILLAGGVTMAVLLRATFHGGFGWMEVLSWVALVAGTFTGGVGLSFMGYRNRMHASEHDFLVRLTALLHVEKGVAESLRLLLGELASGFDCEKGIFAFRDAELERIFVWTAVPWRWQAAGSGESPADERRPVSLRSSGSERLLAAGEWHARGVRMESQQRPASAGIAADAGGGQGTAGGAFDAGRDVDFDGQPAGDCCW